MVKYVDIEREQLAWLAGWLEGEGCFFGATYDDGSRIRVEISGVSTDEETIDKVVSIVGGSKFGPRKPSNEGWALSWKWSVQSRDDAIKLMKLVRPFMSTRRKNKIDEVIALEAAQPRQKIGRTCGTISAYRAGGCRCASCTQANTQYQRDRRARIKREAA